MAKEAGIKANRPKRELIKELNGKENQGTSAAVAQASREKLSPTQSSCRTPATAIQATPATSVYSIGVEGLLQTGLAEAERTPRRRGAATTKGRSRTTPSASLAQELGGVRHVAPLKGLPVRRHARRFNASKRSRAPRTRGEPEAGLQPTAPMSRS